MDHEALDSINGGSSAVFSGSGGAGTSYSGGAHGSCGADGAGSSVNVVAVNAENFGGRGKSQVSNASLTDGNGGMFAGGLLVVYGKSLGGDGEFSSAGGVSMIKPSDWNFPTHVMVAGCGSVNVFCMEKLEDCNYVFNVTCPSEVETWGNGGNGTYNFGTIKTGIYSGF